MVKIGIDIGGSHIGIGIVEGNKIVKKIEKDFAFFDKTYESSNTFILNYVSENIEKLMEKFEIELVGIGAPGIVKGNSFVSLVNLGLEKIDFSPIINKFENIKFKLRNDAKSAGIAEHEIGSLKGYKDCVFLCLGTGIGSAVIMNNTLLKTRNGAGFELGHMVIDKNGTTCNCGKKGCFETCCSIKRFKDNVRNILSLGEVTSEEIKKNIQEKGDQLLTLKIENVVNKYVEDLIIGISNIIDIFEPEAIALGGSFVYFKEIFYEKLLEEMNKKMCVLNKKAIPKIVLAKLKNDAGIIGSTM